MCSDCAEVKAKQAKLPKSVADEEKSKIPEERPCFMQVQES